MQNVPSYSPHATGSTVGVRPLRALLLDDSRVDRMRIMRLCDSADVELTFDEAGSLHEFKAALDQTVYDLCLIDYRLPEGDGLIALELLSRHPMQREAKTLMIAGDSQIQVAIDAMKSGCSDFLLKDHLTEDRLIRAIEAVQRDQSGPKFVPEAGAFAREHGGEMRAILSGMLRQVRNLRRVGGPSVEVEAIEASCARLWNFLEAMKAATPVPKSPTRLN